MAQLYEFNRDTSPPELTSSLAQSLKNGFFLPAKKKFSSMETEINALKKETETNRLEVHEKLAGLESELALLRKLLRNSLYLLFTILAGVIFVLIYIFSWY
jgi:hypothetical protein